MKINIKIDFKRLKINRVIKCFVLSDLMLLGGWGLIAPIFAIFIIEKIAGVNLIIIGAVAAVYWTTKSIIQIPIALYLDSHKGEEDDFHALIMSLILAGFVSMAFLLAHTIFSLFVVVFLQGVAFALYTPSWSAIFSRHLDKENYAFEWSLDNTTIGLATGAAALVGGFLASTWGFEIVFILASILSFASAIFLFRVPNLILPKDTSNEELLIRDHTPLNINR